MSTQEKEKWPQLSRSRKTRQRKGHGPWGDGSDRDIWAERTMWASVCECEWRMEPWRSRTQDRRVLMVKGKMKKVSLQGAAHWRQIQEGGPGFLKGHRVGFWAIYRRKGMSWGQASGTSGPGPASGVGSPIPQGLRAIISNPEQLPWTSLHPGTGNWNRVKCQVPCKHGDHRRVW